MSDPVPSVDLERVLAEIDDEVRRRRESGDIPADLERELDELFARFAPVTPREGDLGALVEQVERTSFITAGVPVESSKPGVAQVKRVLRKLMAWYMHHLAAQVTAMGGSIARALRVLIARVELLSNRVTTLEEALTDEARLGAVDDSDSADAAETALLDAWGASVGEVLSRVRGRVLHADCADGRLVRLLAEAGVDAYGVDPRAALVDPAAAGGLDVRPADVLEHLDRVEAGGLAAVVLSRAPDRRPRHEQVELVRRAAAAVRAGGLLVLLGTPPPAWGRDRSPVEADLAPGRPLHAETWAHLAGQAGFDVLDVRPGAAGGGLDPVPGDDEASAAVNANLERIAAALFGPDSYLVVATKRDGEPTGL